MTNQAELIRKNFAELGPRADELVERFYALLFHRCPEVSPLFEGVDMETQRKKLKDTLIYLVSNLTNPHLIGPALRKLGAKHKSYGAKAKHYPAVGACLLATLEELSGESWTPELAKAWREAFGLVSHEMLAGASET